ncbi:MAG: DNA repair protein RecO [Planctomycetota bacterium]
MRNRDQTICLRTVDYSETSQVVTFFTRDGGVVRLIAKGSKRAKSKTGGTLDMLAEGELVYTTGRGDSLGTVVEFSESSSHAQLRRSGGRLNTALYMLEVVTLSLAEHDPHPEVFDLLSNSLRRIGEPDAPVPAVLAYFQWRLLRLIGLLGDLDACACCGRPADSAKLTHFSPRAGGPVCGSCAADYPDKTILQPDAATGLATLVAARAGRRVQLIDQQAQAVNCLLAYHLSEQLGRRTKMARHAIGGKS